MVILRVALFVATWASCIASFTSPNAKSSVQARERVKTRDMGLLVRPVNALTTTLLPVRKMVMTAVFCAEIISTIVSAFYLDVVSARGFIRDVYNPKYTTVSAWMYIGAGLAIAGAFIRLACFQELGTLFTFELSIRDKHVLIKSGPYAFVRHPSYTGAVLVIAGATLVELSPGSWWAETRMMDTVLGRCAAAVWVVGIVLVATLLARAPVEDDMLRARFGAEWDAYAKDVQWWFIPRII